MKNALFSKSTGFITDIGVEVPFEIDSIDMEWVEVPDEANDAWVCIVNEDGSFAEYRAPKFSSEPEMFGNFATARGTSYKSVGEQLDMMYHHIASGGVMGDAEDPWVNHVNAVKAKFPKNNPKAVFDELKKESVVEMLGNIELERSKGHDDNADYLQNQLDSGAMNPYEFQE
jgi:hypothetical protein